MRIRRLRPEDREALFGPRLRHGADAWLERQERGEVYVAVAELDGVPVARVGLDFAASADPGVVVLWAASVGEEWRGRGVGTALMRHLEQVAVERGRSVVELLVAKDNPRARALYERLGYVTCGEAVNRWVEQGDGGPVTLEEECWRMRKRLGE